MRRGDAEGLEGGELEGVVAAVETEEELEKESHERREEDGEESEDEDEEHVGQGEIKVPLSFLRGASRSGALPFFRRRPSSSRSTTMSNDSKSSALRRLWASWLRVDKGVAERCSDGNKGPCMLFKTSLKGTARESSKRGRAKGDLDFG